MLLILINNVIPYPDYTEFPLFLLLFLNVMVISIFKNRYDRWLHNNKCFLYLPVHMLLSLIVIVILPMLNGTFTMDIIFTIIIFLAFGYAAEQFNRLLNYQAKRK
ncbi:hypothetical protein [Macrococcus lamae]|uniref:hypothetical protein n=1 Tax=Macrococcus lamae TaxID=198484 RepID=UPI0014081685|nr:hypothetical protein [Macrococcus lamae]